MVLPVRILVEFPRCTAVYRVEYRSTLSPRVAAAVGAGAGCLCYWCPALLCPGFRWCLRCRLYDNFYRVSDSGKILCLFSVRVIHLDADMICPPSCSLSRLLVFCCMDILMLVYLCQGHPPTRYRVVRQGGELGWSAHDPAGRRHLQGEDMNIDALYGHRRRKRKESETPMQLWTSPSIVPVARYSASELAWHNRWD